MDFRSFLRFLRFLADELFNAVKAIVVVFGLVILVFSFVIGFGALLSLIPPFSLVIEGARGDRAYWDIYGAVGVLTLLSGALAGVIIMIPIKLMKHLRASWRAFKEKNP